MKKFFPVLVILMLSGCGFTPQGDIVREFVRDRVQKAADQSAKEALNYLCEHARVGSLAKLFTKLEDRRAYRTLCDKLPPMVPLRIVPLEDEISI